MSSLRMTHYFNEDTPLPEDFPWTSWADFQKDAEQVWEHMKSEGVRLGHLEVTPEGWLKGHGEPSDWFDAVDVKLNDDRD